MRTSGYPFCTGPKSRKNRGSGYPFCTRLSVRFLESDSLVAWVRYKYILRGENWWFVFFCCFVFELQGATHCCAIYKSKNPEKLQHFCCQKSCPFFCAWRPYVRTTDGAIPINAYSRFQFCKSHCPDSWAVLVFVCRVHFLGWEKELWDAPSIESTKNAWFGQGAALVFVMFNVQYVVLSHLWLCRLPPELRQQLFQRRTRCT